MNQDIFLEESSKLNTKANDEFLNQSNLKNIQPLEVNNFDSFLVIDAD